MPFATTALARRLERAERVLFEEAARCMAASRPELDVTVRPMGGGLAVWAGAGSPFNKLAGLGFADEHGDGLPETDELAAYEQLCFERDTRVQVEVNSLADPAVLSLLGERGYRLAGVECLSLRALQPGERLALPDGVRVEQDAAPRDGAPDAWLDAVVTGFVHPDTRGVASHESFPREVLEPVIRDFAAGAGMLRYVARLEDGPRVVGGASMRLTDGLAQLCGAATLPEARGRGVQTGLLNHRLAVAAEAGCDLAVVTTQPGSTSQRNMHRHGFELVAVRSVLVLPVPGR